MELVKKVSIPTHSDERGELSVIELKDFIDYPVKRIYYVTGVKADRGAHAVIGEKKIYVCMNGAVKAKFHDGVKWHEFDLKGPSDAVIMEGFCWKDFYDFDPHTVLAVISNMNYEPEKYIYDFDKFLKMAAE